MACEKTGEVEVRYLAILIAAALLPGCASEAPLPPVLPVAATQDEAAIIARIKQRCPEADKRDIAELKQRPARPPGDRPVDKAEVRGWVDRLEASDNRKAAAGMRIAADYERCRMGAAQAPAGS